TAATMRSRLHETILAIAKLPDLPRWLVAQLDAGEPPLHSAVVLALVLVLIAVGVFGEWLFGLWTAPLRRRLDAALETAPAHSALFLVRAGLEVAAAAAFALAALVALFSTNQGRFATRQTIFAAVTAAVALRLIRRLLRLFYARSAAGSRTTAARDENAVFGERVYMALAYVAVIGLIAVELFRQLGLDDAECRLLSLIVGTVFAAAALVVVWTRRASVAARIKATAVGQPQIAHHLADYWHVPAMAYGVLVWLLWMLNQLDTDPHRSGAGLVTVLIPVLYVPVTRGLLRLYTKFVARPDARGNRRVPSSVAIAMHIGLLASTIYVLAEVWGVPVDSMMQTPMGHAFARAALHVGLALVLAFAAWEFIEALLHRHLSPREVGGTVEEASARLRTLLPLLRTVTLFALVAIAAMVVLSSIGVDIGPLLAGAGVIGLAIGFGTQTLVRDVVSGILFLIEDAFRIGDYIEVDKLRGTVEVISLRSMRLRHHRGAVHTLPYGQIRSLTNYTRDWVIDKIELTVPHGTDIEKVRKLLKKIGQELTDDPELGPKLIEPLKSQGIARITDSGLVVRIKFMSQPREQFAVRRKALSRILEVFAENGIDLGQPRQVQVHVRGADGSTAETLTTGSDDPDEVTAAAAARAAPATGASGGGA
ncbi:MAG TPA: mechanosensitive ion channel family protein, partial [Candidatus Cybelea sp.]|nr:mechanosensitive ion channel family protein [Candidatus Cybelea sp.]